MNHEWANDSCANCKITRSKTTGGTTKYTDTKGKTRWTPGPCVAPARLDPSGDAEPKTILTSPLQGKTGPVGPATAHIDRQTGKRTELRAVLVTCSVCGTKARFGQDISGWSDVKEWGEEKICPDCQEPEKAEARTIKVRLVPVTRTDLMCLVCGMFRTELGVAHGGEGDMQIGVHKRCIDAAHVKRGE